MYEPMLKLNGYSPQILNTDFVCGEINATTLPEGNGWGLDALMSHKSDMYSYPIKDHDNGVDIYIMDDGVLLTHDEFYPGQVIRLYGTGPEYIYSQFYNHTFVSDHGTHVAGSAGGINYGVSKNFTIYDLKICWFFDDIQYKVYCPYGHVMAAFETIIDLLNGANKGRRGVINMSIGGLKWYLSITYEYYVDVLTSLGGIVVVAAGNEGMDACLVSPAFLTNAITVGAYNNNYKAAWFSNWGDCVDVWAPGVSIISALAACDSCYASWQGTSMAAPHISGLVTNLLYINPLLTFDEIKELLLLDNILIDDFKCNTTKYICEAAQWECNTTKTFTPSPTIDGTPHPREGLNYTTKYACNFIQYVTYNDTQPDLIEEIEYLPTDTCISGRDVWYNTSAEYSYMYKCDGVGETVNITTWSNNNCSGVSYAIERVSTGYDEGLHWYTINCYNPDLSEAAACNLDWYRYTPDIYDSNVTAPEYLTYDESYIDYWENPLIYCPVHNFSTPEVQKKVGYSMTPFIMGVCYNWFGYGYMMSCNSNGTGIMETYYSWGMGCTNNDSDIVAQFYYGKCYGGTYNYYPNCPDLDAIELAVTPTGAPSINPTLTPTKYPSIAPIPEPTHPTNQPTQAKKSDSSETLSVGETAGLTVGLFIGTTIAIVLLWYYFYKYLPMRKKKKEKNLSKEQELATNEGNTNTKINGLNDINSPSRNTVL